MGQFFIGIESLDKVTNNAKNILNLLDVNVPLLKGQTGPLVKELRSAPEAHGENGMDGLEFENNEYPVLDEQLSAYMYETIMKSAELIDLIAIGPLTNIALLLKNYPDIKSKIHQICLMGGGIDHGNVTSAAEFNIYVDPEAAKIVFDSGVKIVMAGLDVTEKAYITREEIETLKNKGEISNKIYKLLDFYNISGRQFGFENSPLHDLCTTTYLLEESLFEGENCTIEVITNEGSTRGMTLADKRKKPDLKNKVYVLKNVKRERYLEHLFNALEYFDQQVKKGGI